MTAPALIALAYGPHDRRATATGRQVVGEIKRQRPDLRVEAAFLGSAKPALETVVERLERAGVEEAVVVPLLLLDTDQTRTGIPEAMAAISAAHPGIQMTTTPVLGLDGVYLEVLDRRMREALRASRVRELDALVLAATGSSDTLANQAVARAARIWGQAHRLPCVAAYACSAPPATGEAVRSLRAAGRRHIAVAQLFLTEGPLYDRAAELALEAGAVAVSAPLGADPEVARTVLARYCVGAVELVPV